MAYDATKYQLTKLLQDAWYRMGQLRTWKVTGGSTTTIVNSAWAGVEEQIYEDDDPSLVYGTAVVIRDAGGLNAAPEGEMGQVSHYDSSNYTATIDAISSAVAVGDKVGFASPLFPLEDMIRLANIAIRGLGEIDIPNTSLTTIGSQTEYALPSIIQKYPIAVNIQTNKISGNSQWVPVQGYKIIPATTGTNWTLVIPHLASGYSLQIIYRDLHPELTAFDSEIIKTIHPELAISAVCAEALQWYNNEINGSNEYFLQRENKMLQNLEAAKVKFPIKMEAERISGLPHWGSGSNYVPLTSDQRI